MWLLKVMGEAAYVLIALLLTVLTFVDKDSQRWRFKPSRDKEAYLIPVALWSVYWMPVLLDAL
ncbi:hypothetical protein [Endozoicomonas ascidiicola]|uniref:hypothetical protein n=1 Tax=Endozoicomonas ascidiicola TaxID=1698521 RepID=UPI0008356625|nr:hypothetical protein [Endozoicomonas ascidiicola]